VKASWAADATYAAATLSQKTTAKIGYTESVIYPFLTGTSNPDGINPDCNGLVMDKLGNLYGNTFSDGGTNAGNSAGTVFKLTPAEGGGWTETVLYVFNGLSTGFNGFQPCGTLAFDSKGNLYGTTVSGGEYGLGTVYELTPAKTGYWTATSIYSFKGGSTDGFWPVAGVTLGNTTGTVLYGTTTCGGTGVLSDEGDECVVNQVPTGAGTVYELTYTAATKTTKGYWTEAILHNFTGNGDGTHKGWNVDGWDPEGGLLFKNGNLYGVTQAGGGLAQDGTTTTYTPGGVVFGLTPKSGSWDFNVLYNFGATFSDGYRPVHVTPVMDTAGNLYGTTAYGGTAAATFPGYGTVWELLLKDGAYSETLLYSFGTNPADGWNPNWGIVPYKTGWYGANNPCVGEDSCVGSPGGTAFELTYSAATGWQETILYQFTGMTAGSLDVAEPGNNQLIVDTKGNLYGMGPFALTGNSAQYGGVYEISAK
jgi:uncharacterized repeat protein (TIGR03803 family)